MNYYPTIRIPNMIDINNFSCKFKQPIYVGNIKIKSETLLKSYNDLYQTFTLPVVGDYSNNFTLLSDYILKGYKDNIINVDCLCNYIESITLNINNRGLLLSQIDNLPRINTINPLQLNEKSTIKLEFLNLPLLTKCANDTNYLVGIKFKQTPPINYMLSYDVMFVDDPNYSTILNKEYFTISYQSQQSKKTCKNIQLTFDNGQIGIF